MNVLYIGPYRQEDEWGLTSRAFANLLVGQEDLNVTLRPIWFNNQENPVDIGRLEEYEFKHEENPEVLIQHGLPSYLSYNGNFKTNIAITSVDCRVDNTDWVIHLNLFDKIIVFSEYEKDLLVLSGVETDIFAFPFAPVILSNEVQNIDLNFNGTKYYTVGSLDIKSGLRETIAAYLATFSITDDVILIVMSSEARAIEEEIKNIKKGLGIFKDEHHYPHIALIDNITEPVMNYVHDYADFFIDVSYNLTTSQNLIKAIIHNSMPIMLDTCSNLIPKYNFIVQSKEDNCIYPNRPLPDLYSGKFTWKTPQINRLAHQLKMANHLKGDALEPELQKVMKFKSSIVSTPNSKLREALCI